MPPEPERQQDNVDVELPPPEVRDAITECVLSELMTYVSAAAGARDRAFERMRDREEQQAPQHGDASYAQDVLS
jgi:hypothetical protein